MPAFICFICWYDTLLGLASCSQLMKGESPIETGNLTKLSRCCTPSCLKALAKPEGEQWVMFTVKKQMVDLLSTNQVGWYVVIVVMLVMCAVLALHLWMNYQQCHQYWTPTLSFHWHILSAVLYGGSHACRKHSIPFVHHQERQLMDPGISTHQIKAQLFSSGNQPPSEEASLQHFGHEGPVSKQIFFFFMEEHW